MKLTLIRKLFSYSLKTKLTIIIVLLIAAFGVVGSTYNSLSNKTTSIKKTSNVKGIHTASISPTLIPATPSPTQKSSITRKNSQSPIISPTPLPTTTQSTSSNYYYQLPVNTQSTNPTQAPIYVAPTSTPIINAPVVVQQDCSAVSSTVANIRASMQPSIDRQTLVTANELGQRGIISDSGLYQQEMQNALQPIYTQINSLIAQFCLQVLTCSCP